MRLTSPLATTQRKPSVDATSVAQKSGYTTVSPFQQVETEPHSTVEDTVQRGMMSCMCETLYCAPLTDASMICHPSGVTSCNPEPVSMELTCCPSQSVGMGSTNATAVASMHKETDSTVIPQRSDSPAPDTSDLAMSRSATPSQTNHKKKNNTVCVQASLETCFTGSRTGSPSHCESSEQSVQLQTLQDHSSNELESTKLNNNSQSMGPSSVDVGDSFEIGEEEEEQCECMEVSEVSEVMRTMLDDIRMADPGMDIIPLQAKPPLSLLQEAEWPSMEEVHCRQKRSCCEADTNFVGSDGVPLQTCVVAAPSSLNAMEAPRTNTSHHASAASSVAKSRNSGAAPIHNSEGKASQDHTEPSRSQLPALHTKCSPTSCDLGLDEMDTVEDLTGASDLRPRSSTPLLGSQQGKLARVAWDCSPVQSSSMLEGLPAHTSFQIRLASSSKAPEENTGDSVGATSPDRGTDLVQPPANVRRGRSLASGNTNKRRASGQNQSWPKRVLKTTTSTRSKLAASAKGCGKRKAVTATPLTNDPYALTCSHDSGGELGLPVTPNPPSLQPPSTSQTESTSYPMKQLTELESSLQTSSIRSVCAIIHIGGGGLPPMWTLLKKGSRRLRRTRKRRGSNTDGPALPHHCQVDILCTL